MRQPQHPSGDLTLVSAIDAAIAAGFTHTVQCGDAGGGDLAGMRSNVLRNGDQAGYAFELTGERGPVILSPWERHGDKLMRCAWRVCKP